MEAARETVVSSFPPVLIVCLSQYFTPLSFPFPFLHLSHAFLSIFGLSSFLYRPLCIFLHVRFLLQIEKNMENGKRRSKITQKGKWILSKSHHKVETKMSLPEIIYGFPLRILYWCWNLQLNIDCSNISLTFWWCCSSFCLSVPRKLLKDPRDVLKTPSSLKTAVGL